MSNNPILTEEQEEYDEFTERINEIIKTVFYLGQLFIVVLAVLKITGIISWSWLWVMSPGWILSLIALFFLIIIEISELIDLLKP